MHAITFSVRNVHIDPPGLRIDDRWKLLVNVDGDLEIAIDSVVVFTHEINFPELWVRLNAWRRGGYPGDFSFDSMDFEETGVVRFERRGHGFVFASCFQAVPSDVVLEPVAVDAFVTAFDSSCTDILTRDLGLDLAVLLEGQ